MLAALSLSFTSMADDSSVLNASEKDRVAQVLEEDGLTITAFLVNHRPAAPAFGYRFDYRGRSVVVSGDTAADASLAEIARGADVLVHEAQANHLVALLEQRGEFLHPSVNLRGGL